MWDTELCQQHGKAIADMEPLTQLKPKLCFLHCSFGEAVWCGSRYVYSCGITAQVPEISWVLLHVGENSCTLGENGKIMLLVEPLNVVYVLIT